VAPNFADGGRCAGESDGAAPFFAAFFARHPDLFLRLCGEDLARARTRADYPERLARWVAERGVADGRAVLRRFKYYELARITVRELCTDLVPEKDAAVTLGELSFLADALLHRALDIAAADLASRCGPPRWRDEQGGEVVLRFCALGLGKLGSEELNYSSDVDLIYVFESPPPGPALVDGAGGLTPVEYFTRLAQAFGRLVGEITPEGFLYRIDLDLRPEGSRASSWCRWTCWPRTTSSGRRRGSGRHS